MGSIAPSLPEVRGQAAGDRLAAVVALSDWEEEDESDDPTEVQVTRKVRWTLTLIARDEEPEERERLLSGLLVASQNALNGQSLAGITIPEWSKLRRGRLETASSPEQRMTVMGEFTYWIDGFSGH